MESRLAILGREAASLDAIFLTHEHSDHVRGVGPIARSSGATVYSTQGTLRGIEKKAGKLPEWRGFRAGEPLTVGDLIIEPYETPHDARETVAFTVHCDGKKIGHATDMGKLTPTTVGALRHSDVLLVEANHDVEMLMAGPYSWPLKRRIRSEEGHLSNEVCGELISQVVHSQLKMTVLMHLSETNNCPEIAQMTARQALGSHATPMILARQDQPTPLMEV